MDVREHRKWMEKNKVLKKFIEKKDETKMYMYLSFPFSLVLYKGTKITSKHRYNRDETPLRPEQNANHGNRHTIPLFFY